MKLIWIVIICSALGGIYFMVNSWNHNPYIDDGHLQQLSEDKHQKPHIKNDDFQVANDDQLEEAIQAVESHFDAAVQDAKQIREEDSTATTTLKPQIKSPWQELDPATVGEELKLRSGIAPTQLLKIDLSMLHQLKKGDLLTLPINTQQKTIKVDKVETLWNGDLNIQGSIQAQDGGSLPAVISSGKNSTFASFSTEEGSFELEAFGNIGALYSVNEMDKKTFYPETDELTDK